ncbi:MAG: alanyl-tRNA editing protein [Actinomycetota bacterium]
MEPVTDKLYLRDAYLTDFAASVVEVDDEGRLVALDRTAFYATGGGQPNDIGTLSWGGGTETAVVDEVRSKGPLVWHHLADGSGLPEVGREVMGIVDWPRRHQLMRTHTAMHLLCGVIWNEYETPVTGGNMEPLGGRMDFEFDPLPEGFGPRVEELVNAEIAEDRPIEISFLDRSAAMADPDLIRTKVNLIPDSVTEIRVVDIVGLDRQADGGTHVRSTGEVGRFTVVKTESKGKGNKRIRIALE